MIFQNVKGYWVQIRDPHTRGAARSDQDTEAPEDAPGGLRAGWASPGIGRREDLLLIPRLVVAGVEVGVRPGSYGGIRIAPFLPSGDSLSPQSEVRPLEFVAVLRIWALDTILIRQRCTGICFAYGVAVTFFVSLLHTWCLVVFIICGVCWVSSSGGGTCNRRCCGCRPLTAFLRVAYSSSSEYRKV